MKVLVTGGGGQLGRALVAASPTDCDVFAPTRAELDITDKAALTATVGGIAPDVLINAAAYTAVDRAESDEVCARLVNSDAVIHLAGAARAAGVRLVHVSTDFVFDGMAHLPYVPSDEPHPLGVYGRTKLAGERFALANADSLVVRTAWVYGAHGANFVKTMLRLMTERLEVRVVADQIGTPTHAASLARTIWGLIEHDAHGVFHVSDAGAASWYDFAVAIQEEALALGLLQKAVPVLPISTADYPTPARRPAFSVLDKSATWALLGKPAAHWRSELRLMLTELKELNLG